MAAIEKMQRKLINMKNFKRNISIRAVMIIVFLVSMVISMGSIGYLVFRSWFYSANQTTEDIAAEMNGYIYNQIYNYLHVPEQINEFNHKIIANEILDMSDENLRDKFFVGVLKSYEDEIYSFSYANINGDYYGARRTADGEIQIIKNDSSTGGNSRYYAVNEDMTAGELILEAGKFDPRTRDWYKAAAEQEVPTFSPVYKHFVENDLAVSFVCPVYDKEGKLQGVIGTHLLISGIESYIKNTVSKYNGYAVILEKGSDKLISNSMGVDNYTMLGDGTIERNDIDILENPDIKDAYKQYLKNRGLDLFYGGRNRNLFINVNEIQMAGLSWVLISAIPEAYLITPVTKSMYLAATLSLVFLILSFMAYTGLTGRLLKPMKTLMQTSDALSSGDLTKRIDIVRHDEIGKISESFNQVANQMQFMVNNLEATVKERTEELRQTISTLDENKSQLQLILDSTAEAIYGIDIYGNCTFCNLSCLRILGYTNQSQLLGKNMHNQIHHTKRDGTPLPMEECKICKTFSKGEATHMDDEVFWRADGTCFDVDCYSYPQIKNGVVVGAVITFMDVSDRKQKEAEIQYLSSHDTLTGLHNRRCFDEYRKKIDCPENLPLSVIFADINGLKMTNDIFGHTAGDNLIKKSAEILQQVCRQSDVVARVGGDEFIILLPGTNRENAQKILYRIKSGFTNARVEAVKCSIALGLDTKTGTEQMLDEVMANAENAMYKDKTMNRKSVNRDIIDTIIGTLHVKSPIEKQHSTAVGELCSEVGAALNLPETEINKLKRAGFLHDIGKIVLDEDILIKEYLSDEELEKMQQHAAVGYRILNLIDDTLDLAEYVYAHHEKWDGTGYPRGLKGEQIHMVSRIIAVTETYDRILNNKNIPINERKQKALDFILRGAGVQFDPQIAKLFVHMIEQKAGK